MSSEAMNPDASAPGSAFYNSARKQYLKSKRNRPPENSASWTPFRVAEKKYMAKFPPPDLCEALDLALLDEERKDEINRGMWKGRVDAIGIREIGLKENQRKAFCVPGIPGLVILPGYLSQEMQRRLVRWSLAEHARKPNETNLDAHYKVPAEGIWNLHVRSDATAIPPLGNEPVSSSGYPGAGSSISDSHPTHLGASSRPTTLFAQTTGQSSATASELLSRLRWANIGWFYNWTKKQYEFEKGRPDVGEPVRTLCKEIVRAIDWKAVFVDELHPVDDRCDLDRTSFDWDSWDSSYEPDAGIVNFYRYKDTLMGHVDRAEVCATSPLVSLSLGNAAVFLIGGLTRDQKPIAILLRSGDAIVMAGPRCRRAYHGVPRILEGTMPAHFDGGAESGRDWAVYSRYLQTTRINVNVRQVFPKGFDPSSPTHAARMENGDYKSS